MATKKDDKQEVKETKVTAVPPLDERQAILAGPVVGPKVVKLRPQMPTDAGPDEVDTEVYEGPLKAAIAKLKEKLGDEMPDFSEFRDWKVEPNIGVVLIVPSYAKYSFSWDELGLKFERSAIERTTTLKQ